MKRDARRPQTRTQGRRANVKDLTERFELFVDSIADYAIFLLDPTGRAVTWNIGVQRVLGYNEEEFIGLEFRRLFPEGDEDAADQEMRKAARDGRSDDERWHRRKDGGEIWVSGVLTALRQPNAGLRGYAKVMRDATAHKKAETLRDELLRRERDARDEAERANHVKDEFLAILSHELRTPLNAILGWARLLAAGHLEPARAERAAQIIQRNAEVQAGLIDDLLDVSSIITGTFRLNVSTVTLGDVVKAAVESARRDSGRKKIHILLHCAPDVPAVQGDIARLQRVVGNLLSNALKFTPAEGTISIELRRNADEIELIVRDTGQGIPPASLPHIFDRFHQSPGMRRSAGGLGLGLAIVRHIAAAHRGSVEAKSEGEGKGATFVVRLPLVTNLLATSNDCRVEGTLESLAELAGLCALVVEDRVDARELVDLILRRCHMRVIDADSIESALQAMDAHHIDVIVSDISLVEDDDGLALVQAVRARPSERGRSTPAIALTAYASPEHRMRVLAAGYQAHVPKPVDPASLIAAVAAVVKPMAS